MQEHVAAVEIVDSQIGALPSQGTVARLHDDPTVPPPVPPGIIVPKKYLTRVGEDEFQEGADRRRALQASSARSQAWWWSSKPSPTTGAAYRA